MLPVLSILSITIYSVGFVSLLLGIYAISFNRSGIVNRLFLAITVSLAIWSFAYSVALSAPTAEESTFWRCITVFGWGIIYSIVLHFVLVLGNRPFLKRRMALVAIYLPALINIILYSPYGVFGPAQYDMMHTEFGWVNTFPTTIDAYWLFLYYIVFGVVSLVLLFRWLREVGSNIYLKKDVVKFKISFYFAAALGILADILPDILEIKFFPKVTVAILFIPLVALFMALKRFGMFFEGEKTEMLSSPYDLTMADERDRTLLFQVVSLILLAGGAMSFLIRFFVTGGEIVTELSLSLSMVFMALISRLIPVVIKDRSKQNTVFLLISVAGTLFFAARNFDTGAVTVWSVYVLFFMLTVILGSRIHSLIFALISIAVQIAFMILQPKVLVAVNHSDYFTRIIIIGVTYSIVQLLITMQTVKVQKYERAMKEQGALEKISSNFISFNKENAEDKVKEMFEMSAQILDFDYAYLFEVAEDYKDATLLSAYVNSDLKEDASSYRPGMKFGDAFVPVIESLTDHRQFLVCDDVAGISIREHEGIRNYFMSKEVNSFAVLPVTVDDRIHGILCFEYRDRADRRIWENRLSVLKILANVLSDAKKKLLYEERLYQFAYFDEATKMANLNMLIETLGSVLHSGRDSEKIAIFDIKLQNLKTINDTFGYDIGDRIVLKSASIIKGLFEDSIIISRTSGKEFAVVFACDDYDEIKSRAERAISAFSKPIWTDTKVEALYVIVKIGISIYPEDGEDVLSLLINAELAGNKAEGSDENIVFYNPQIKDIITETTLLTNRLFRSLENDGFYLEFQPQIDVSTGKTAGFESLLRLKAEGDKSVSPEEFVPILETTGLIYDVGYRVLRDSIAAHQSLIRKGLSPVRCSVNVSVIQFKRHDFVESVAEIIEETQIDPRYIELEITESALSDNLSDAAEKISELKKLGISIAIDDFGRGYSSLHRLESVPFDRIKIDKGITDNINPDGGKNIVTETIISMAKAFKAQTTIEGVETKEQVDFLKSLGCSEIQGYYFSKPLSLDGLEEFLRSEI